MLPNGVSYDDANNTFYATGFNSEVQMFRGPAVFAGALTAGATNLQSAGATVVGLITPNGLGPINEMACPVRHVRDPRRKDRRNRAGSQGEPEIFEGNWEVLQSLTGLQPHKTYHYRFVAINKNGRSAGEKQEFTTLAVNPGLEAQPAASATFADATLYGTVNPENLITKYHFEYGPCLPHPTCSEDEYGLNTPTVRSGEAYGETRSSKPSRNSQPRAPTTTDWSRTTNRKSDRKMENR